MPPRSQQGRGAGPAIRGGPASRGGPALRGGPAARGGASGGLNIPAHVKTVGVRRPGYGTGGKAVNTIVNAFYVDVPDNIIHHYDVVINPDKLPARVNLLLFSQLQTAYPQIFYDPAVYDGRKNAYTMEALKLGPTHSATFDVTLPPEDPTEKAKAADGKPPKIFKIKLTKVAEINTEILHQFVQGKQSSDDSAVSTSLTALNVAVRMQPNLKYPFNSRSFFTDDGKKAIGGGIELWRGYFQSIRPTQGRMYINLDVSTGIMYKPGPLLALCCEFLGINDPRMLGRLPEPERIRLQRFISNMRVTTKHTGRTVGRVIKRVTQYAASALMFDGPDGKRMSVANYFKSKGRTLTYPDIPCIEIASGANLPLELCMVPKGQIMRKQIPPDATSEIVEFSKQAPAQRLASIRTGLSVLQYGQSEYVRKFGINVTPTPITLKARILNTPVLRYGDASREKTIKPANGQWNMRDKILYKPVRIERFVIVIFDHPRYFSVDDGKEMIQSFCDGAASVGINIVDKTPLIFSKNPQQGIATALKDAGFATYKAKGAPPSLMVVVLPEGGNQIYTEVKHFGDISMGVPTQCLKSMKCKRAKLQYWANVMLKINAKMGGINNILDNNVLNDPHNPTIVMGADVIHPAPGADGKPSFTSLVCSVDSTTAKYVSVSDVQRGRQEIIEDLEDMVGKVIDRYKEYGSKFEKNRRPVTRLVFYRDGVSEGQFQQVLNFELPAIKKGLQKKGLNPKVTLIIVGKRHHIRMFPSQPGDADRTGNCQAGTTIDEGLGHPTEFDYYQLSHGGLLGTSRPAHYSVIYDDNNFNADAMQNLSFALCHVYARATRSVSIPAPVYYADIVCSRSKNHFAPGHNIDTSDGVSHVTGDTNLAQFKAEYKAINAKMANEMYFM